MNSNYATNVKEEIDKLLKIGFIRPVKRATLLSPIVVIPKKNGRIRVCVDYRKLNTATVTDGFPLPFTDIFVDGFSGYNQIQMHPDDQEKMAFVTEWGVFVVVVMKFGLKMTPATFHRIISEIFSEYFPPFMHVYLDDFAVYTARHDHLHHLRLYLERCCAAHLSLNPAKCTFGVTSGALDDEIVNGEGIAVYPGKIYAIIKAPISKNVKALVVS